MPRCASVLVPMKEQYYRVVRVKLFNTEGVLGTEFIHSKPVSIGGMVIVA